MSNHKGYIGFPEKELHLVRLRGKYLDPDRYFMENILFSGEEMDKRIAVADREGNYSIGDELGVIERAIFVTKDQLKHARLPNDRLEESYYGAPVVLVGIKSDLEGKFNISYPVFYDAGKPRVLVESIRYIMKGEGK